MTKWQTIFARAGVALPLALGGLVYALRVLPHASGYAMRVLAIAGVYAVLALGYRFIFGLAGALSLAQGSFMGLGAYVSGILATRYGIPFDAALPASIGLPVVLALLVAVPVLRLQTHYFALATLLIGQIALLIAVEAQSLTGGANGMGGIPPLSLVGVPISGRLGILALTWGCVAICALLAWQVARGRWGDAFAILRANPAAARAIGLDTGRLRLTAFLLSAAYAGLAGSLYVHEVGVLSPDVLGFPVMITCLTIAVVGSRLRISGAILGAALIIELPEWVRFLQDDDTLAFGCILLVVVIALPEGMVEAADRLWGRLCTAPPASAPKLAPISIGGPWGRDVLLEINQLSCSFGGVRALDDVSLVLHAGEVLGLIGPNGSGKTTLLNAITGIFLPQSGRVQWLGHDVTGWAPHRMARLGMARTFQTPALVGPMSALDNVAIARNAAQLGLGQALRAGAQDRAVARAEAMTLLDRMGAASAATTLAGALPPGLARRVEIARALACAPRILLLDEPAAGLTETEQADLVTRLRQVAAEGVALLVIEHNMRFLLPLTTHMLCLDRGRVIAFGTPQDVQTHPQVIEAYLGAPFSRHW